MYDVSDQLTFLKKQLREQIDGYERKRARSARHAGAIRFVAIGASALLTTLLGVKGYVQSASASAIFSIITVAMSACLTALTTWEAFFDSGGLWVRRMRILAGLHRIEADLYFRLASGEVPSAAALRQLFDDFQSVVRGDEWIERRARAITSPLVGRSVG